MRIWSDIDFGLALHHETKVYGDLLLKASPPSDLLGAIGCGFPLYLAHGRKVYLYSDREFDGVETGQPWCYEVQDVVRFYWYSGTSTIYYRLEKKGSATLLGFWFIHLFLPLYFTLENRYQMFHGGAVTVEDISVMFMATSMGGKSTLTDYFIQKGHTLISDDKIPTFLEENRMMLVGAHPYHRPYRQFEDLGYRVSQFIAYKTPLSVCYLLERADKEAAVEIEEVKGFEKFYKVLPHYLFSLPFLQKQRMYYLSQSLKNVEVFVVKIPWSLERLDEVYRSLTTHILRVKKV